MKNRAENARQRYVMTGDEAEDLKGQLKTHGKKVGRDLFNLKGTRKLIYGRAQKFRTKKMLNARQYSVNRENSLLR